MSDYILQYSYRSTYTLDEEMACEQAHKINARKRAGTRFPAPAQSPRRIRLPGRESKAACANCAFLFGTRAECVAVDVAALATRQDT